MEGQSELFKKETRMLKHKDVWFMFPHNKSNVTVWSSSRMILIRKDPVQSWRPVMLTDVLVEFTTPRRKLPDATSN